MYSFFSFLITLLAIALAGAALYQCFFALIGHFYKAPKQTVTAVKHQRIGVLIAAYKEDAVIVQSAKAALVQYYPKGSYEVVVIADSLKPETLSELYQLPIRVIEVSFEQSTKARALRAALAQLDGFDAFVILDGDNFMHPDFLERVNQRLLSGWKAIQCQRSHKNLDGTMAILDGLSETVNNQILCKGHSVMGLSARLAGSGMAFESNLFREVMSTIDAIGGFDKEMELKITAKGIRVHYDHDAVIYDEKVQKSAQFAKQRGRWIAAQYKYAGLFMGSAFSKLLRNGQIDHFNKFVQMTLPPRLVLPFVLVLGALISPIAQQIWWIGAIGSLLGFAVSIPVAAWSDRDVWKAFLAIPNALLATFKAFTWIPAARKSFLHTTHH